MVVAQLVVNVFTTKSSLTLRQNELKIRKPAANIRLAQWGPMWFIESLCYYCKFVLADNFVFQNPTLHQAPKR
jgi:hypothetical protein